MDVYSFVGEYTIQQGSETAGGILAGIKTGDKVYLGTNTHDAPFAPMLNPHGIGFSIWNADSTVKIFPPEREQVYWLTFHPLGYLYSDNESPDPLQRRSVQLSMYRSPALGRVYRAIYGVVIEGDPRNVAVIGADDDP